MDPASVQTTPSIQEDEWDTDGFVIPSLGIEELEISKPDVPEVKEKPSSPNKVSIEDDKSIYLGPHGAPPSQVKQELNTTGRKRLKQKLKEADKRFTGTGRENKVENLRELVGSSKEKGNVTLPKSSPRDWLDPHCHESQFQKPYSQ